MTYEEKVKALEIFNVMNYDRPWGQDYRKEFYAAYKAWVVAMDGPIQKMLEESELRKSLTAVVKLAPGEVAKAKPGSFFLRGLGYWDAVEVGEGGFIGTFAVQTSYNLHLGKVTVEAVDRMVKKLASSLLVFETEAVNMVKDSADRDKATLYIKQDFVPIDDPTLIKMQRIGVFGWEELGVVAHD